MLQHIGQIAPVITGVTALADNQRPFVKFLVNNWPLTVIAAVAMAARLRERYKAHELSTYNVMADAGLMLSPLVGIALLKQLAQQDHDRAKAIAAEVIAQQQAAGQVPRPQG